MVRQIFLPKLDLVFILAIGVPRQHFFIEALHPEVEAAVETAL